MTAEQPDRAELEEAKCWFDVDRVPRQPAVTAFKRGARLHQARWRDRQDLPMGSHFSGRPRVERPNGSRIDAEAALDGGNFLSPRIRVSVERRFRERYLWD